MNKRTSRMPLAGFLFFLAACGGGGGGGRDATLADINAEFPFTPNRAIDVYYSCALSTSALAYELHMMRDMTFTIAARLDTGDIAFATGSYTYANDVISIRTSPNNFIQLDEQTNSITPVLGLVGAFTTQVMLCLAVGHEEDDPSTRVEASYLCPEFSEGSASSQVNAFEFDVAYPGSIFRDRNRWVVGNDQPLIQRGYGVHRKKGDRHYGYFGVQFDDYNVVTGSFGAGAASVRIDQLPAGFAQCERR